jgi:DNA-binding NtrC family response regulator
LPRAHVLVIDDEPNILTTVRRALEIEGFTVDVAGSGAAGMTKLAGAAFDLVLLDVMMPGETGLELLPRLRAAHPEVSVVMMSGNATIETAVQATRAGAHDFIEKPLSSDKLLLTVGNTLGFARLRTENARLRARAAADGAMIGRGPAMKAILDKLAKTAPTSGRVLITGENGTGKELVARAVHDQSKRKDGPFIKLNCAAIPAELIESELFGHEKGAFTGAASQRRGKFELADGGTLFLDEIGDMTASAQAKVLRVLQESELERVGGHETIKVDVRVVAATNKNLPAEIAAGRFREDLYYRLAVVPIELPPLRARREDVPGLAAHFVELVCRADDRRPKQVASTAMTLLMQHEWPGNVRELKNVMERLVILTGEAEVITDADVADALPTVRAPKPAFARGRAVQGPGGSGRARHHRRRARGQRPPRVEHRQGAAARAQPPVQEDARTRHRPPRRRGRRRRRRVAAARSTARPIARRRSRRRRRPPSRRKRTPRPLRRRKTRTVARARRMHHRHGRARAPRRRRSNTNRPRTGTAVGCSGLSTRRLHASPRRSRTPGRSRSSGSRGGRPDRRSAPRAGARSAARPRSSRSGRRHRARPTTP